MPEAYLHAIGDLLAFGRSYFTEHQRKDSPHRVLGRAHRSVNHDWYQAFGTAWTLDEPIPNWISRVTETIAREQGPEAAEIYQAIYLSHDFADRLHDALAPSERRLSTALHIFILWHPEILEEKFGVDVIAGRIHRVVDGADVWESSPETVQDYERLRRYVERVLQNDPELQDIIAAFEKEYRTRLRSERGGR